MSGNDLLVMVPARGRKANAERLIKSFSETATCADLVFVLDDDDEATYEGVEWGNILHGVLSPRGSLQQKLNQTAAAMMAAYPALMWTGDDHEFKTPGWDRMMLDALEGLGGHGWVYPDTVRRRDVPEIWLASASITETLGWFFPPAVHMYYGDNSVAELGKRSGLIRWCHQAVIEHLHHSVRPDVEHDAVYREAEAVYGQADLGAYRQWQADVMPYEVARLRREHNPDVRWVLGRVA